LFAVAAVAYDRFMGRYSIQFSSPLADLAGITAGARAIDVGCGPGALTGELVARLGASSVTAVDPSESFVEAARERYPGVDVRLASAESLPFPDGSFDAALAQLVVHFMSDPVGGIREMARVVCPGGTVVACVWDHAGERSPLTPFWRAARELVPDAGDESAMPGARQGHLVELFEAAGLADVGETVLTASVEHATFDGWWELFTLGVGPAGAYLAGLDDVARAALRERCRASLGDGPFVIEGCAWAAKGTA
jgi:ubiquinone/menaquinone biosynthesis C-methylase UbiE